MKKSKSYHTRHQTGLSLIELMISLTVASILSIAVLASFMSQSSVYVKQNNRTRVYDDGRMAYDILMRLIRHAESGSVSVTDNGTDLNLSFTIPAGYPIWPNLTSPNNQNHIFVTWSDHNDSDNALAKHQIRLAKSTTDTRPANDNFTPLAGSDNGKNTRITDLNITKQADNRNYRISVVAEAGNRIDPVVSTFDGLVMPRN